MRAVTKVQLGPMLRSSDEAADAAAGSSAQLVSRHGSSMMGPRPVRGAVHNTRAPCYVYDDMSHDQWKA